MAGKSVSVKAKRKKFLYRGKVQGVGFRFTFSNMAGKLGIKGYVRNLRDGSVEAVCEGPDDKLRQLSDMMGEAMGRYISSCGTTDEQPTGEFSDFKIVG
jgi:acylphosphatase